MPGLLTLCGLAVAERIPVTDGLPIGSVQVRGARFAPGGALVTNPGGVPAVVSPDGLGFDTLGRLCTATVGGTVDPLRGGFAFDSAGRLIVDAAGAAVIGYQGVPITAAGALPVTVV